MFQSATDEHDEDDFGGSEVFADEQSGDGCDGDSEVGADAPVDKQFGEGLVENPPTADDRQQDGGVQISARQSFENSQRVQKNADPNCRYEAPFTPVQIPAFFHFPAPAKIRLGDRRK
jgi:hypothetical protein